MTDMDRPTLGSTDRLVALGDSLEVGPRDTASCFLMRLRRGGGESRCTVVAEVDGRAPEEVMPYLRRELHRAWFQRFPT
jgi:hypothetical protein